MTAPIASFIDTNIISELTTLSVVQDSQGLCIHVDNSFAKGTISLFGAHILSYIPKSDNTERLWVSENAIFDGKTPIRGGVPICWPWFAAYESAGFNHPNNEHVNLPSHGFVRTQYWRLKSASEDINDVGQVSTTLRLIPTALGKFGFSDALSAELVVVFSDTLDISLISTNHSDNPVELTQALHTYLSVPNIHQVTLAGITQAYDDKPSGKKGLATKLPYLINEEVDRIHCLGNTRNETITIQQTGENSPRDIVTLRNINNDSVVVWNPWKEKSASMVDMGPSAFETMLCIEAANTQATLVAENSNITLRQIID